MGRRDRPLNKRMQLIMDLALVLEPPDASRLAWEIINRLVDPEGYDELKAHFLKGPNRGHG